MNRRGGTLLAKRRRACICVAAVAFPVCDLAAGDTSEEKAGQRYEGDRRVRDVRVLIASKVSRVRLRSTEALFARDDKESGKARFSPDERIVLSRGEGESIRAGDRHLGVSGITIGPEREGTLRMSFERNGEWSPEREYPGDVRLLVSDGGRLEVINAVEIERYVACVVANEVWPSFDTQAYRGQAIAARSFVLYQMSRRSEGDVDIRATQGSQVYKGIRRDKVGQWAKEAAEYTRGVVLVWEDKERYHLFCTYYSSACGGMSQSAAPLGADGDVPPLRGGVKCDYCKIAPGDTYRWGPVKMSVDEVMSRLVSRYPKLSSLGRLRSIEAIERTPSGRPVTLRITGSSGETHDIVAERFRLAIDAMKIRSTDCRIRVLGRQVIFDEGKGFGHGLGLCQWGMHGQAKEGKRAGAILRYYYPGARLVRAY